MTADERETIVARLEGWGRWLKMRTRPCGRSPLLAIMVSRGYVQENAAPEAPAPRTVDEKDAALIDAAWRTLPKCPEKAFLLERYVFNRTGDRPLRGIPYRRREEYRTRAYVMIDSAARRLKKEGR